MGGKTGGRINIVLTAAGRGTRFGSAGYRVPKPLIEILGEPMYVWALRSLPLESSKKIIFVAQTEHLDRQGFRRDIESRFAGYDIRIVAVESPTEGQACTALLAAEWIDDGTPLIIHNADTYFVSDLRRTLAGSEFPDGIISVFEDTDPKWSFVRTDGGGRVLEVAEKRPISTLATTGMYHFGSGRTFVEAAETMIRQDLRVHGEFYVAPVYNLLIRQGARIGVDRASEVFCFGTPEDLHDSVSRLERRTASKAEVAHTRRE